MGIGSIKKIVAAGCTFVKAHKATICVCGGMVAGTVAIVECGKATYKSVREVDEVNADRVANGEEPLKKKEVVKLCKKNYYPTIGLTVSGIALISFGYRLTLRELASTTAVAKAAQAGYDDLRDSINDILDDGTEEKKTLKDSILNKFEDRKRDRRLYGDGPNAIDICDYTYSKSSKIHPSAQRRFKDKYGAEFESTKGDVRAAISEVKYQLSCGLASGLADFYANASDNVKSPDFVSTLEWNPDTLNQLNDLEVTLKLEEDADGPYYWIQYSWDPEEV